MTILLVDDYTSIRGALCRVLEEEGHSVPAAGDGMDALEICRQSRHRIDLLVTDVEMPGMSGFDWAEHAAQLQPLMSVQSSPIDERADIEDRTVLVCAS